MHRIILKTILVLTIFMFSVSLPTPVNIRAAPAPEKNEPISIDWWSMFLHDPEHSGYSSSPAPGTKKILWTYTDKKEYGFYASTSIVDGKVYAGTIGQNLALPSITNHLKHNCSGSVLCLNANTGDILWKYTSRYGIMATPAVANGKVVVCSGTWDWFVNKSYNLVGDVFCLNATNGQLIWEYQNCCYVEGSPVIENGLVYFGSFKETSSGILGWVWCFNSSTGALVWRKPLDYPRGPVTVANGKVYVALAGGNKDKLQCLDAQTGETLWVWNEGNQEEIMAGSTVAKGKIYVATEGYGMIVNQNLTQWIPGDLHCLDADTGTLLWQANLNTSFYWSTPAVAYGNVYLGSGMGQIVNAQKYGRGVFYCVNATTGQVVWKNTRLFPEKKLYYLSSGCYSPAIADGKVYVGCDAFLGPSFFCFDAFTGKTFWTYKRFVPFFPFSNNCCESPSIADGKVIEVSSGTLGKIICFT